MFEEYLIERGFDRPEHEPDLGLTVRPSISCPATGSAALRRSSSSPCCSCWPIRQGVNSQEEVLKPIRRQIHAAARKLREAEHLGHPLVAVLTDPVNALFGLLNPQEVIAAIRGDMTVTMPIHPGGGAAGDAVLVHGRNGELRRNHPYLSAVVVIHYLKWTGHTALQTPTSHTRRVHSRCRKCSSRVSLTPSTTTRPNAADTSSAPPLRSGWQPAPEQ